MDSVSRQPNSRIMASLQSVLGDEKMLFQVAELFPIPIEVYRPDGALIFCNRALAEFWNLSDETELVGKFNLLQDPITNDELGLRDYVQRIFTGELVLVPDSRVPLDRFATLYKPRHPDFDVESMYCDILSFPIRDAEGAMTHIVSIFITTRMYLGKSDVAVAKEYIENHWLEEFDMDSIAQAVSLSRYHFARLFKKHTGMTPYSYYQDIKLRRLKEALCNTNLSITEAFATCGMAYSGNFARVFREKVGMTPSQYRKSMQH